VSGIFWDPPDHADLERTYSDDEADETAGGTYTQPGDRGGAELPHPYRLEVPSERHRQVLRLLRATSRRDQAGRLVSWWPQDKLARKLGVSVRTLQGLLADLREPGSDPRHPMRAPPGLRLGLVKVEPTYYRDPATGRYRLGGNLYVLTGNPQVSVQTPRSRQHATGKGHLTSGDAAAVACLNKGDHLQPEGEEVPPPARAREQLLDVLDVGHQRPSEGFDHDPTPAEVLAALDAGGLGPVEVLVWPEGFGPPPPRPAPARERITDRWTIDLASAPMDKIRLAMRVLGMFDGPGRRRKKP
jgi:hypothetical protein